MPVNRRVAEGELQDAAGARGRDVSAKLGVAKAGRIHQRERGHSSKGSRKIIRRADILRKPEGHIVALPHYGRDRLRKKTLS